MKKKYLWLLPFCIAVTTYFHYEKVCRTMRLAIVSYLLKLFFSLLRKSLLEKVILKKKRQNIFYDKMDLRLFFILMWLSFRASRTLRLCYFVCDENSGVKKLVLLFAAENKSINSYECRRKHFGAFITIVWFLIDPCFSGASYGIRSVRLR